MSQVYCLIMAGGQGTRFWPESTRKKPKQYLSLTGKKSLLSETLLRFDGLTSSEQRFIITTTEQETLAKEHSKGLVGADSIILEPEGRNTAPCITLALAKMESFGVKDDDVIIISPSDHVILNKTGFEKSVHKAVTMAQEYDSIVTIGIPPNFPHTGFGYIEKGETKDDGFKVNAFKEKPDFETAKTYLESGNYFWNAGMFMAKLGTFKKELEHHAPKTFMYFNDLKTKDVYSELEAISFDYAVMEKSNNVMTVGAEFDWNDLGSWDALENVCEKIQENTILNQHSTFIENAKGNTVYAPNKFVSLIDVEDLIVVSNDQAVVVLPKASSQKVKNIVNFLKEDPKLKDLL